MHDKPLEIDSLITSATPVQRLRNRILYLYCTALFLFLSVLFVALFGLRKDLAAVFASGLLIWKNGSLALLALGGVWLMASLSRPVVTISLWHALPFLAAFLLMGYGVQQQGMTMGIAALANADGWYCLGSVIIGSTFLLALIWPVWLQRTASPHPQRLGAASGVAMAGVSATAYAWHCPNDHPLFFIAYYIGAIAVMSVMGLFLGKRYLRW